VVVETTRTCGYEGLGRRLAREVRERERRADAFERAEVPEDHRGLAGPEAENGLVGLAPLFVEQSCANMRVWARRALEGLHTRESLVRVHVNKMKGVFFPADPGKEKKRQQDQERRRTHSYSLAIWTRPSLSTRSRNQVRLCTL
jgi:hypothetical protein